MEKPSTHEEIEYESVGMNEEHVARAPQEDAKAVDDALGLQPISIRLQKDLLDNLKALAQLNGIGYQPLIRQILTRWTDSEMKKVLLDKLAHERAKAVVEPQAEVARAVEVAVPMRKAA